MNIEQIKSKVRVLHQMIQDRDALGQEIAKREEFLRQHLIPRVEVIKETFLDPKTLPYESRRLTYIELDGYEQVVDFSIEQEEYLRFRDCEEHYFSLPLRYMEEDYEQQIKADYDMIKRLP